LPSFASFLAIIGNFFAKYLSGLASFNVVVRDHLHFQAFQI